MSSRLVEYAEMRLSEVDSQNAMCAKTTSDMALDVAFWWFEGAATTHRSGMAPEGQAREHARMAMEGPTLSPRLHTHIHRSTCLGKPR